MVSPSPNFLKNKLLAALSNADLALLQPHLEPVELGGSQGSRIRPTSPSSTAILSSVGLLRLSLAIATNASKLVLSALKG